MKTSECSIVVRYSETTKQGFVHHSNYFKWFDIAQEQMLAEVGMSYLEMEEGGLHVLPINNVCHYYTPAKYGDTITIRTTLDRITGVRLHLKYEIVRSADGEVIATGESEHIVVNDKLRPMIIKTTLPKLYDAWEAE